MPDLSRRQLALYAAGLAVRALFGARYLAHGRPGAEAGASREGGGQIRVEGAGGGQGGRKPGVYRLAGGARFAMRSSGPAAPRRADLGGVNLAAKLEDGRQIVPVRARAGTQAAAASSVTASSGNGAVAGAGAARRTSTRPRPAACRAARAWPC